MNNSKLKSIIESILFISGAPLKIKKIAKATGVKVSEIEKVVEILSNDYKNQERGLWIFKKDDKIQMATKPENSAYVEKFTKSSLQEDLSPASLETLAVISYRGPITRLGIEEIRGVNCSFILRSLLIRGLIERIENPGDARSYLYRISFDFLKKLGIQKVEDLPNYEELKFTNSK